jgi:hypothetical protein
MYLQAGGAVSECEILASAVVLGLINATQDRAILRKRLSVFMSG